MQDIKSKQARLKFKKEMLETLNNRRIAVFGLQLLKLFLIDNTNVS